MKELNKIQKEFIWKNKNPKIKYTILRKNYDNGGLKKYRYFNKNNKFAMFLD